MRYVYLHGFASGPTSRKAAFFADRFRERGIDLEIPDLAAGDFEHLTVTGQLSVIKDLLQGDEACLIGSSMGGYMAALYASRHSEVNRVVLLAPAFGFARRWPEALGEDAMTAWKTTGWLGFYHYVDNMDRRVHYQLLTDASAYDDFPHIKQPALVFHGTKDEVVPSSFSEQFAHEKPHITLHLLDSGHELTDQVDFMWSETERFLLHQQTSA